MSHAQGNDLAASDRNANTASSESAQTPPNTRDTDIDTIFDEYFPLGTVVSDNSINEGKAELMTKLMEYHRNKFKAAIEQKLTEARIDELSGVQLECGVFTVQTYITGKGQTIEARIKALQASKEGK